MSINKQTAEYKRRQKAVREVVNQIIDMDTDPDEVRKFKNQKNIELMASMVWPTVVRGRSKREKDEE